MSEVIPGVLGSVIGYLGAEVAKSTLFVRLLWPQRYYNDLTPKVLFQLVTLHPMGGPLHRAALETLDVFRDKGLYRGRLLGHMLGTAFLPKCSLVYFAHLEEDTAKEVRNGFWMTVMTAVKWRPDDVADARRTMHPVFQLHLKPTLTKPDGAKEVREDCWTWQMWTGLFASELTALGAALFAGLFTKTNWLAAFFMVPLVLKILAALMTVQREKLESSTASREELFEIKDQDHGFFIITGPDSTVRQFFRHYGHPRRNSHQEPIKQTGKENMQRVQNGKTIEYLQRVKTNMIHYVEERKARAREVFGLLLVYTFVFYFPAGLVLLLWMDKDAQYLWLVYQVYTIAAMHVVRLGGYGEVGRTEEKIARLLTMKKEAGTEEKGTREEKTEEKGTEEEEMGEDGSEEKRKKKKPTTEVWLTDSSGNGIAATLEVEIVKSAGEGKKRVETIKKNWKGKEVV
ncbi:hypothetical protein BDD12DRAFT_854075 [Trichophaea hybrida]|nr:hypothetical protein BDD12DRAFT_854075 [Trichophaea hybrida]